MATRNKRATTSTERVQKTRAQMRALGMKPIQIWVPDTTAPGFARELARQSKLIAANEKAERDVLEFIEQVADTTGWTA